MKELTLWSRPLLRAREPTFATDEPSVGSLVSGSLVKPPRPMDYGNSAAPLHYLRPKLTVMTLWDEGFYKIKLLRLGHDRRIRMMYGDWLGKGGARYTLIQTIADSSVQRSASATDGALRSYNITLLTQTYVTLYLIFFLYLNCISINANRNM